MSLVDLRPGQTAQVVSVHEPGAIGERLMEMGLVPGAPVELTREARFGLPMQLLVRG